MNRSSFLWIAYNVLNNLPQVCLKSFKTFLHVVKEEKSWKIQCYNLETCNDDNLHFSDRPCEILIYDNWEFSSLPQYTGNFFLYTDKSHIDEFGYNDNRDNDNLYFQFWNRILALYNESFWIADIQSMSISEASWVSFSEITSLTNFWFISIFIFLVFTSALTFAFCFAIRFQLNWFQYSGDLTWPSKIKSQVQTGF